MGQQDFAAKLGGLLKDWPRLTSAPHRFGGLEFRVDRREIGHVHPAGLLDLPFPVRMRRDLVAAGRAEAHHTLPHSGWVSFRIRTEHDLPAAVELLRLNYDRLVGTPIRTRPLPMVGRPSLVRGTDPGDLQT